MPTADALLSKMNTTWRSHFLRSSRGHRDRRAGAQRSASAGEFGRTRGEDADWSFETRLAVAEKAGLIRGGCAQATGDCANVSR